MKIKMEIKSPVATCIERDAEIIFFSSGLSAPDILARKGLLIKPFLAISIMAVTLVKSIHSPTSAFGNTRTNSIRFTKPNKTVAILFNNE